MIKKRTRRNYETSNVIRVTAGKIFERVKMDNGLNDKAKKKNIF